MIRLEIDPIHDFKPNIFLHYNKTKSTIDTSDELLKEYTTKKNTNRWPKSMFYHLSDIGI